MIYFLLAAYNEEKDLPKVLSAIENSGLPQYHVLIVNDGSSDATVRVAKSYANKLSMTILEHETNKGLGCALSTGFHALAELVRDSDIVVTLDADGTHPLKHVPEMIEKINEGSDIVIASRYLSGGQEHGVPVVRRLLSRCASVMMNGLFGLNGVRDYTSGYRAFSGKTVRALINKYGGKVVEEKGFTATLELLLKASGLAGSIAEVPLDLHYEEKSGASKMKVFKTVIRYFALFAKFKLK